MHATLHLLTRTDFPALRRRTVETLQLNLGYRCNQSCLHCHVNAGPKRTEEMTAETIDAVLDFIAANPGITTIDLTGGAPELNPRFRRLVVAARTRGLRVIDRWNLTILEEPGFEDMADFLAQHRVEIVASLPCYLEENVDSSAARGFSRPACARCKNSTRWATAEKAAASASTWSTTRKARACRRPRSRCKPPTSSTSATSTASCSTNCSPWPTCRSSASAAP